MFCSRKLSVPQHGSNSNELMLPGVVEATVIQQHYFELRGDAWKEEGCHLLDRRPSTQVEFTPLLSAVGH